MKVEGLDNLNKTIDRLKKQAEDDSKASVTVGFTQNYALYVHEDMSAKHPHGQAKYLEQPARELSNSGELGRLASEVVKSGGKLEQGLLVAGLRIQREAQLLVPIDTSALKASAFTAFTRDEDTAAYVAFEASLRMKDIAKSNRYLAKKRKGR